MRILFVVPYVPNQVRTRSFNLIRQLSARGHQVTLVTVATRPEDAGDLTRLKAMCRAVHCVRLPAWHSLLSCAAALGSAEPLQAVYSWSPRVMADVRRLQADADIVHVEHLRGVRYALGARHAPEGKQVPVVWDSVDCISYLFEQAVENGPDRIGRLINRLELARTRRYEGWLTGQFSRILMTSDIDRQAMLALRSDGGTAAGEAIAILPNGVDTEYFSPADHPREPRTLVFSGKMSYHANVRAALELIGRIMPIVWKSLPDVRLQIVGKDPPAVLQALAQRHSPLVQVTGTVPDVRPYLRRATAAAIPLVYGAGSQFKVLEAMACGTPVVASSRATGALAAVPGRDLQVADGPEAFSGALVELIARPAEQRAIGEAGRRYVEAHHRWDGVAARLERLYEALLAPATVHRQATAARPWSGTQGADMRSTGTVIAGHQQ